MKKLGLIFVIIAIAALLTTVITGIIAGYKYNNEYKSLWTLADRSSTIEQKAFYIDKFVQKLESGGFEGMHNAIILKTPSNSFDYNLQALKSLQMRLIEIKDMDPSSFEYQTALEQITGQEQGEAEEMMCVFQGVYYLDFCIFLWDWVVLVQVIFFVLLLVFGAILLMN